MHSNTSRILELFCHELKKLIAHFILMVSLKLLVEHICDCCRFIPGSVVVPPGSVVVPPGSVVVPPGSVVVPPGSVVVTTGRILVPPGSVITTGSILVPPGSVITTGSILVTPVLSEDSKLRPKMARKALASDLTAVY
ncbi:hypothetical protein Tco_0559747 [Tanacetum coccineum]